MDFLPEKIDNYSCAHTSAESQLLAELNRDTHVNVLIPRMLSGHLQGRVLSMLSHMIKPKFVLEIGTYTGYSALCISEGLAEEGKILTIDINAELESMISKYFNQSPRKDCFDFRVGNALEIIPEIDEKIDLVFIDADKHNYSNYFDLVIDKMNKGGYIIADNVLWSGKVIEPNQPNDKDTPALKEYNKKIHDDPRVENVLLPVRDGLMIARVL